MDPATSHIYSLSLHDALPIFGEYRGTVRVPRRIFQRLPLETPRSEEHTSELQSLTNLVCRLLLEKKKPRRQKSKRTITDDPARNIVTGSAADAAARVSVGFPV